MTDHRHSGGIWRGQAVFGDLMAGRNNNFDFLRFFLAAMVIFSHSAHVLNRTNVETDPFYELTRHQEYMGHMAVCGFFAISGCLVTMSWFRSHGVVNYFRSRILRIFPGFVVSWLVCAFVVLPLSGYSWPEYVELIRPAWWLLKILLLRGFGDIHAFPNNPQHMLNTSLWSIPVEFGCYILVAVLGICRVLRIRAIVAVLAAMSAAKILTPAVMETLAHQWPSLAPASRLSASLDQGVPVTSPHLYFLLGMLVYLYREKLPFSATLALAATILAALSARSPPLLQIVLPVCWTYLLFYIAYCPSLKLPTFGSSIDLSYGLYLYGWPIQQLLVHWFEPHLNWIGLFLITMIMTMATAYISWTLVERPSLQLKKRRRP